MGLKDGMSSARPKTICHSYSTTWDLTTKYVDEHEPLIYLCSMVFDEANGDV
jgi:hypothetical protein